MNDACCGENKTRKFFLLKDPILYGSTAVIVLALGLFYGGIDLPYLDMFAHKTVELIKTMWWGVALGIIIVGLMNKVPREYFTKVIGRGDTFGGVVRATIGGVFLDLCSHGILMVGAKLYERGASLAQVMAFLVASPWNSLSLTIILISLIGLNWTLLFIAGSVLIAMITGIIFLWLTKSGILPENVNFKKVDEDFKLWTDMKQRLSAWRPSLQYFKDVATGGLHEGKMILRWLLLGVVLASALHAFVPEDIFSTWLGPTFLGLITTLVLTTILEVCSEGSAPIASEIMGSAGAPGNAFTFLMAGVATDYTEIMVLRDTTKSWKCALFLPLVSVPQVLVIGYIMNVVGG